MDTTVAIVGAGPGGLAAAVLLAARGARVTLFERQPAIGGRTARISATGRGGERYAFDCGPTFFLMPYVLEEVFAAAGRRLADYADLRRLDPMYRLVLGREQAPDAPIVLDATQDIQEMACRIAAIDARDGANFPRFIADNRYKLRHSESILRNPMRGVPDLFTARTARDTLAVGPVLRPHMTVSDLLSRYFRHPQVRRAVAFQSKYLGMSPHDCPSLFTILPFIEYEYGVWHPVGGCHALMQALARVAEELGVEIRAGQAVQRVAFEGVRATGVVVEGEHLPFDHVVLNADAMHALRALVPGDVRARAGERYSNDAIDQRRYSCSTFMLYLGVRTPVSLPHHTIYVSASYDDNLADITDHGRLSPDPSFYVCNPSALDPSLAPQGHSALYVLVPVPNLQHARGKAKLDWSRDSAVLRAAAFRQISRILGPMDSRLQDLESRVAAEVRLTPDDWRARGIHHGATFNLAHNLGQMLWARPQNRLKGFDNLWLVGGGTHPGSGLPTIFLSAQITARMLGEEAGLAPPGVRPRHLLQPS